MIVNIVHVYVKPDFVDDFIAATKKNHEGSIQEPGNLRFDVLQNPDKPGRFVLYEAFESEDAVSRHKETPHYLKWRLSVADWMEKPREGFKHNILFPLDKLKW